MTGQEVSFLNYGAHCASWPEGKLPYFTAAAAIGMTTDEIFLFTRRLDEAFHKFTSQDPITLFKQNAQLIVTEEIENNDLRRLPADEIKIEVTP